MRLIDADALKKKFISWLPHDGEKLDCGIHPVENISVSAIMEIEEAPTIEAVPVVRCEDCVYRHLTGRPPFMFYTCTVAEGLNVCKSDSFCSYGERRKDETD